MGELLVPDIIILVAVALSGFIVHAKQLNTNLDNEYLLDKWLDPPVDSLVRVYLFNFTNPKDFLKGAKPVLDEVGPYVFSEHWEKSNVRWKDGDTKVEYGQKRFYKFKPQLSNGRLRDVVTLPNIPLITALNTMRDAPPIMRRAIGSIMEVLEQEPFVDIPVRQAIWGYSNPLLKFGKDVLPPDRRWPYSKFGVLVGKNDTVDGPLEALTGINNRQDMGKLLTWKRKSKLPFWSGDKCNEIKGTDGFIYPPNLKKSDTIFLFHRDICRSLPLEFQEEVAGEQGLDGYRFVPPSNVFGTPKENPDNACFCNVPRGCATPSGVFNISSCQYGSPTMLSWPHFFQADPKLVSSVVGLKPEQGKHQLYVDVQPKLGTGLRGAIRSQINIQVSKVNGVKQGKGLRDILLPVVWFSDDFNGIQDPKTIARLKAML